MLVAEAPTSELEMRTRYIQAHRRLMGSPRKPVPLQPAKPAEPENNPTVIEIVDAIAELANTTRAGVIAALQRDADEKPVIHSDPSVDSIKFAVCREFGVSRTEINSARRDKYICDARQVGMAITRHLTSLTLPQIGKHFGGRDHTTVLHACRKFRPHIESAENSVGEAATVAEWASAMKRELAVRGGAYD